MQIRSLLHLLVCGIISNVKQFWQISSQKWMSRNTIYLHRIGQDCLMKHFNEMRHEFLYIAYKIIFKGEDIASTCVRVCSMLLSNSFYIKLRKYQTLSRIVLACFLFPFLLVSMIISCIWIPRVSHLTHSIGRKNES